MPHGVLNALSVFSDQSKMTSQVQLGISIVLTLIAVVYALALLRLLPRHDENCMN